MIPNKPGFITPLLLQIAQLDLQQLTLAQGSGHLTVQRGMDDTAGRTRQRVDIQACQGR
jgi:hypothetical protein